MSSTMKYAIVLLCLVGLSQALKDENDPLLKFMGKVETLFKEDTSVLVADDPLQCNLNDVVGGFTELIRDTADTIKVAFNSAYQARYSPDCTFSAWRCFLKRYTDSATAVNQIKKQISDYLTKTPQFTKQMQFYLANCVH